MNNDTQLRKQIAEDIAIALGLERPPAMFAEKQLQKANIRTCSSLQADRAKGDGIRYVKLKGIIKYPLSAVLDFIVSSQRNHTGDDISQARRNAVKRNLQKAQAKRRPERSLANQKRKTHSSTSEYDSSA